MLYVHDDDEQQVQIHIIKKKSDVYKQEKKSTLLPPVDKYTIGIELAH